MSEWMVICLRYLLHYKNQIENRIAKVLMFVTVKNCFQKQNLKIIKVLQR
jgi:hypothetical protein